MTEKGSSTRSGAWGVTYGASAYSMAVRSMGCKSLGITPRHYAIVQNG